MFRIAVSSSGYRNSCRDPAKITVWPPLSRRCRSRASGMPSKMAAAAADIHQPYHYLTYYAKSCIPSPQVTGTPAGDLGPVPPLAGLRAATMQATAYRLGSRYSRLASALPDLLGELTRAAYSYSGHHHEEAYGLLAMAYRAADAIADKYGYTDLSARAIELIRWAAARAGDPLIGAMAAYVRTELFLSGQHPSAGLRNLDAAITSIEPTASRDAAAIYGSLHMRGRGRGRDRRPGPASPGPPRRGARKPQDDRRRLPRSMAFLARVRG